jgi:hypothetical protein
MELDRTSQGVYKGSDTERTQADGPEEFEIVVNIPLKQRLQQKTIADPVKGSQIAE